MTIRHRLTLMNAAVIGVVTSCMALAVYSLTAWNLDRTVDHELVTRISRFRHIWEDIPVADRLRLVPSTQMPVPEIRAFIDERQRKEIESEVEFMAPRFIAQNAPNAAQPWDLETPKTMRGEGPALSTVRADGDHIRVVTLRVQDRDGKTDYVQFAENLASVDGEKGRLAALLWVLVPLSWFMSGIAGMVLTHRALSPVRGLIRAARSLDAEDPGQRLPVKGEDEMAQLAQIINGYLSESESNYRRLERFVGDASHELRTPLTTILLRSSAHRNTDPSMQAVYHAASGMRRTIDDLLLLARLDSGHNLQPELVDLGMAAGEVADDFVPILGDRLEMSAEHGTTVKGSPSLLKRVMANLLENAAKHAGDHANVFLTVQRSDDVAVIKVLDDGTGIPQPHVDQVFDRFYRVDAVRTHDESWEGQGSGLGLSIVKTIVLAHGGEVTLTSRPDKGTEFCITLPLHQMPEVTLNSRPA